MIHYKFSKEKNLEFSRVLKNRVNTYFSENQISKNDNPQMFIKSGVMFTIYLTPFFLMLGGVVVSVPLMFVMWGVMGMGKAFIGTSVMHDALHGSYSKNKIINQLMGFSAMIIGADANTWKLQHNVLHHTYTNIEDADDDIAPRYVMRFTPHQPRLWFHRYQHVYALFFYAISTVVWITFKDFFKIFGYRNKGLIQPGREFNIKLLGMFVRKTIYHGIFLGIPMFLLPISPWLTLSMFLFMHLVTGLMLSLIFQTAHVMPELEFVCQEDEQIEENWNVHQLYTTSNYSMNNRLLTWFVGGLNFQIEHHLFPNICHVHYRKLSEIVRETSAEFDLPYHFQKNLGAAVRSHFQLLKELGRVEQPVAQAVS